MNEVLDYAAVAVLGALVGAGELISRYRDAPREALYTRPALLYVVLNTAASAAALALVRAFEWTFGAAGGAVRWTQVLAGGVGAMALFRTSLFTVRAGDADVGIGPGSFLQVFRDAADREVDRIRAQERSRQVGKVMDGLSYTRAAAGLTPFCLALMQNLPPEEQTQVNEAVRLLNPEPIDEAVKVRILGLLLMNLVGPDVLAAAVASLRDQLKQAEPGTEAIE